MQTVLFHSTIFGPIRSRRLGVSLGINLMPNDGKVCSFDCLYCEAGFNAQGTGTTGLPSREEVRRRLDKKLSMMHEAGDTLDVITFSGNGEPTLHPEFRGIIDDTLELRDKYFPEAKVSVLSNATRLDNPDVVAALRRVDNNILKLDSAIAATAALIDRPVDRRYSPEHIIEGIRQFDGHSIMQTLLVTGQHDGQNIDNTTDEEIDALIDAARRAKAGSVMLYSIDRKTPAEHLRRVGPDKLNEIAERFRAAGIDATTA